MPAAPRLANEFPTAPGLIPDIWYANRHSTIWANQALQTLHSTAYIYRSETCKISLTFTACQQLWEKENGPCSLVSHYSLTTSSTSCIELEGHIFFEVTTIGGAVSLQDTVDLYCSLTLSICCGI